jgi:hypothetical protein
MHLLLTNSGDCTEAVFSRKRLPNFSLVHLPDIWTLSPEDTISENKSSVTKSLNPKSGNMPIDVPPTANVSPDDIDTKLTTEELGKTNEGGLDVPLPLWFKRNCIKTVDELRNRDKRLLVRNPEDELFTKKKQNSELGSEASPQFEIDSVLYDILSQAISQCLTPASEVPGSFKHDLVYIKCPQREKNRGSEPSSRRSSSTSP